MGEEGGFDIARKTLYWGITAGILMFIVGGLAGVIGHYKYSLTLYPPELEAKVLSSRFLNSQHCFAYQDPVTEKIYPRIIDLSKFSNKTVASCYHSNTTKDYQFKMDLYNFEIRELYSVETQEWWNNPAFTLSEPVQIIQGENISDAYLQIFVQRPT